MVFAQANQQGPAPNGIVGGGGGGGTSPKPYVTTYYEQSNLTRAGEVIQALGPDLMGDQVNEYSGTLEFTQSDVSLPGNNALPVVVGRHLSAGNKQASTAEGLFGDWDLEIPHLHTMAVQAVTTPDWFGIAANGTTLTDSRCSQWGGIPLATPVSVGSQPYAVTYRTWWDGFHLYAPGSGDQDLIGRYPYTGFVAGTPPYIINTDQPSDGAFYPVLTKNRWNLSCTTLAVGTGEGFVAHAPDGTRYQFDHMVNRPYIPYTPPVTSSPFFTLPRWEVWILPSQITDRFGNWVRYSYDTTDPWKVLTISSSDGRSITFTYVTGTHRVQTATDGTRTWTYAYSSTGTLQSVTEPDGSTWQFALQALERDLVYKRDPSCFPTELTDVDPTTYTGTITHPSGAVGVFSLKDTWHGRSNVPGSGANCNSLTSPNIASTYFSNYSLTAKTLSGPGMSSMTWTYSYGTPVGSWAPCSGCVSTETVTITDPLSNVTQRIYGTQYGINEGLLVGSNEGWNGTSALRSTTISYASSSAGPYPILLGYFGPAIGSSMAEIYTPENSQIITQQGVTFSQTVTGFDSLARPVSATDSSSLGFTRTESTTYSDNTANWVVGQIASETIAGTVVSSTTFDPTTALPTAIYHFGKLQGSYAFNADGTLSTVTDPLGHVTTYTSYMRGLAQHIAYADATSISAVVNNIGAITSVTNEAGTTWTYGYDTMGRIASATPPGGDAVVYNTKNYSFIQVPTAEFGIDANHWRQTITQGNAVTINYFDGRWRKLLTTTYDAANFGGTQRMQLYRYDPYNRTTFASYPQRSIAAITSAEPGTATTYDPIGRVSQTVADSELGSLTTTTQYLSGFQQQVTNPRGYSSTTAYQAFEDPKSAAVTSIVAPEGQTTTIVRDVFGKPVSITRSGTWAGSVISATRSYVYDTNQLLCKTVEPEIGATIQSLDAANNLSWRATGLSLTSTTSCDTASVPAASQTSFVYSARNRLTGTGFGDGSPSIGRSYTADGLPQTIISNGSSWTYSYNNRRLLTQETLAYGSTYNIGWAYDANGHVNQLTYPDGGNVAYSPDALGEPTMVSGYASAVTYQPNGAIAGYTLANGIVHSQTQNVRGLPTINADVGALQDAYTYDPNGNVTAITDQLQGVTTRTMTYDGLDRLTAANDPNVWGSGSYSYDPLDNIRTSIVGMRNAVMNYDSVTNRLSGIVTNGTTAAYTYNNQGNITGRGSESFSFDQANRLTQSTGIASYSYDGLGRRTAINASSGINRVQIYDQAGQLLYTTQQQGTTTQKTRYIYLGKSAIAETNSASGTTFLHADVLGSPVATSSPTAAILTRTRYEAYGNTAAGSVPDGPGFTGHVNDPSTGLVYMQQRYYDPLAGRFLSVDPIVSDGNTGGSFGRYTYVENAPYGRTDPDGRSSEANTCSLTGGSTCIGSYNGDGVHGNVLNSAPAPTDENGNPIPPPTSLPDGKNGKKNRWVRGRSSGTSSQDRDSWKPEFPIEWTTSGKLGLRRALGYRRWSRRATRSS